MIRRRPAPSAKRMANSRLRPEARASSRLATLAHAISNTSPHEPSRISSENRAFPHNAVAQRRNLKSPLPLCPVNLALVLCGRQFHLHVGGSQCDIRPEPRSHLEEVIHVVAHGRKLKRQPDIRLRIGHKLLPNYAHYRVWLVPQRKRFAQHAAVAAELLLPQVVAQHHDFAAVRRVLPRRERSAQDYRHAEQVKVTFGHTNPVNLLRTLTRQI